MAKAEPEIEVNDIFSDGGVISRGFSGFESRPQQIRMASAVSDAFLKKRRLAVEAGTGVGKSFAYLVPAIEFVGNGGGKILISTFTITLQEQLINKDIPFLAECMSQNFSAVLAKGRSNYICRRRLEYAVRRQQGLFDGAGTKLAMLNDWVGRTNDGSLSDLGYVPQSSVWDSVKSEHGNCRGRKCGHYGQCFYWRARRRLESADIIVANHALLFSDLALKERGGAVLPDYKYVIIDEAHNIERVAESHFGIDINNYKVRFFLNGLFNSRTHRGVLSYIKAENAIDLVSQIGAEADKFFRKVRKWHERAKDETGGRCYKNFVEDNVSGYLKELRGELSKLAKKCKDADDKFELVRYVNRCTELIVELDSFLNQSKSDYVYWVEPGKGKRGGVRLKSAALNVGEDVKRCLFERCDSVIMTSATLSSDGGEVKSGFGFFAGRIGLADFGVVKLGSPFDYEKQVTLYIETDLPNPNDASFLEQACEALKKYILKTNGRAFVLFTSYSMLNKFSERLSGWLAEQNIELLQQGTGEDRSSLLERFKSGGDKILFGTDSFWQGVDVPGEALESVIIMRLPFSVPNQPLLAGRLEEIRRQGGNPFFDYQLPSAIIKFKQGFGRLIRNKTDKGIVVVLDSRIASKAYGKRFLAAIPKCKLEIVSGNTLHQSRG